MTIEEMKERKLKMGLTNQDIATLTGVPLGTVQKVFAGITASPRHSTFLALEKILGDGNMLEGTVLAVEKPGEKQGTLSESEGAVSLTASALTNPCGQENLHVSGETGFADEGCLEGDPRDKICGDIKRELVLYSHIMDQKGLVNTLEGNLSIYDRENDLLYITPSGTRKSLLSEEKIAVMRGDEQIDGQLRRSSEYLLHTAALKNRPDANAVAHLHAPYLTAYAYCGKGIRLKCSTTFALLFEEIPCLPYGMPGTAHIADGIEEAIAEHDLILLANHGCVAVGANLEFAVSLVEAAEEVLRIYSMARQVGQVADIAPEKLEELLEGHPSSRRNRMRRAGGANP